MKEPLRIPAEVDTMFDLKQNMGVYERLYQLLLISLCSDIEFMFKDLFASIAPENNYRLSFYQRLDDVISELENLGMNFENINNEIDILKKCFQIRHICIHNLGHIDEKFLERVETELALNQFYPVTLEEYREMFDAYGELLYSIDQQYPV